MDINDEQLVPADWGCPNERCTGWHWCGNSKCPIDCGNFDCEMCEEILD